MRYRVYVSRVVRLGGQAQKVAVLEFNAYDFEVNGSKITAYPYSKDIESGVRKCLLPSIDIEVPGQPHFVIHDDHGREVWDGRQKVAA